MKKSLILSILILSLSTNVFPQTVLEHWKWFGGLSASYDVAVLDNPSNEALFKYHIEGYVTYGAEVGLHHKRQRLSTVFNMGNSIIEPSLREYGGSDGAVELPDYFMLGVTFRQQLTRYKEPPNLVFNAGLRTSMMFSRYSGIQATDHPSDPYESTYKDYSMNTLGLESGFYLEVQSLPVNKPGISITLEPLYLGASTKGMRFGAAKLGLSINFN